MTNRDQEKWRPEPAGPHESHILNQDGSLLGGGGGGGQVRNPTGDSGSATMDHPIGGSTGVLKEHGQTREQHPSISGGADPSDLGTSGWLGGDPSNIGGPEDELEQVTSEAPQVGHDRSNLAD